MLAVIRSIWPVETLVPARMGFRRDSRRERGGVYAVKKGRDPLLPRLRVVEEKDRRKNDTIPDAGWEATS